MIETLFRQGFDRLKKECVIQITSSINKDLAHFISFSLNIV